MTLAEFARAAGAGIALGASFNPLASVLGASVAAALYARKGRVAIWAAILVLAWLAGDGVGVLGGVAARASQDAGAAPYATAAAWAAASFLLGYALPSWVGANVGRRVTHGTGWLSAIVVAAAVSLALSTVSGGGSTVLARVL